eukprot:1035812_1
MSLLVSSLASVDSVVIYDFDQTIAKHHLSKTINKNGEYKFNEEGQLGEYTNVSKEQLVHIFGGIERINELHQHFKKLTNDPHVELVILSLGYESVIKQAMTEMNLFSYFSQSMIIGKNELMPFNLDKSLWIQKFKTDRKFNFKQIIFVDDEPMNIKRSKPHCFTIKVELGMNADHMAQIEQQCVCNRSMSPISHAQNTKQRWMFVLVGLVIIVVYYRYKHRK